MTEDQDFRDFLRSIFRSYVTQEARNLLSSSNAFRRNLGEGDYRTPEQLGSIDTNVINKADELSIDFIDELNAKGIRTPEDFETKSDVAEQILLTYREKLVEWLQKQ